MKTIKGDLIQKAKEGEFDLIAHGSNCFCTMGSGIAKQIKREFPEAYRADCNTFKGDLSKLGACSCVRIKRNGINLIVVNAYTQFYYGTHEQKVNYDAIRSCMKWIKENFGGKKIGIPKIGAGLGGGDWKIISKIIEEEMENEDITVVEFSPNLEKR